MTTLTKSCLCVAVTGFATGLLIVTNVINVGNAVGWYMTLPTGAIFSGLFMISFMLEKEVARFDAEQEAHHATPRSDQADEASHDYHAEPVHTH